MAVGLGGQIERFFTLRGDRMTPSLQASNRKSARMSAGRVR